MVGQKRIYQIDYPIQSSFYSIGKSNSLLLAEGQFPVCSLFTLFITRGPYSYGIGDCRSINLSLQWSHSLTNHDSESKIGKQNFGELLDFYTTLWFFSL